MKRRTFLKRLACGASVPVLLRSAARPVVAREPTLPTTGRSRRPGAELAGDVVIAGGGLGGCAAALAAARLGRRVVLLEETDWIGGQLTQQAVPPDEHPWVEQFGITRAYRELRTRIRDYYKRNYPLTAEARARNHLDPGNGGVSRLCCEPRAALAALVEMLALYVSGGRLIVLLKHKTVSADHERDRVRAILARDLRTGRERVLTAPFFLDATELGDLLPLTGTEYVTGAESQSQTGEPHASPEPRPANMQAFTCCFAMQHIEGEDHTIDKPAEYDFWRDYVPELVPPWAGKLLSWKDIHPVTLKARTHEFDPVAAKGLWTYRRIADRSNFAAGTYRGDITLVNWPQNDYCLGNLIDVPEAEAARNLARAKQLSLSLLYWVQTEGPRPDGGTGWPGLRLRRDLVGTDDGLAKHPYIRESRRIRAELTVLEQHVGTDARMKATGLPREQVAAETFKDSVGVGSYRIDLHPSSGDDNYIDISSLPFQIPLGALIPQRVENLLPACKNLGVTHITNGCYRLHPVEWNIGESAGALAAYCLNKNKLPRQVRNQVRLLADFQAQLRRTGVEIAWPKLKPR